MEPTEALRSVETILRLSIAQILSHWKEALYNEALEKIEEKRTEEGKRRDGAVVSDDLLDYLEFHQLTSIINKRWEQFAEVFQDKGRTRVYFDFLEDVRNSIAHSRDLLPFERDLLSGISGQLRNQVTIYRSNVTDSARYYPQIESVTDSFGWRMPKGAAHQKISGPDQFRVGTRLEVGQTVQFDCRGWDARDRTLYWRLFRMPTYWVTTQKRLMSSAEGTEALLTWQVTDEDVGEYGHVYIEIISAGKFHLHKDYDDHLLFTYAVNPPLD